MSDRLADFIINLAENDAARAAFEAAPEIQLSAHPFSAEEQAALLSGDDAQVIACAARPIVAKIFTGVQESPQRAPVVAKIFTGVEEEPDAAPVVAKIFTGVQERQPLQRFAKRA
jgi:hypothetical protein